MKPRSEVLRELNRLRHIAPNGGGPTVEDLHRAVDAGRSDNLVRVGSVEECIEHWGREQLAEADDIYRMYWQGVKDEKQRRLPWMIMVFSWGVAIGAILGVIR